MLELGIVEASYLVRNLARVRQNNDGQPVIHVPSDKSGEALPCAGMLDHSMPVDSVNSPGKSILAGIGFPVVQRKDGPHAIQARSLQKLFGVERPVPFRQV